MDQITNKRIYTLVSFLLLCLAVDVAYSMSGNADQPPQNRIKTIFIAGDSTASNTGNSGWASHLQKFFDADKIKVENRARGGRSSRTFVTEGLWDNLKNEIKPGDTVIIQFGHNDAGKIYDNTRPRGSIPSLTDETIEIDNLATGKHEIVHTFGWYMRKMITDTQARGAIPIVLSMTARNVWNDQKVERQNRFCDLAKELSSKMGVTFIDLRQIIADQYNLLGPVRVRELFPNDHTHTSSDGAYLNASMVISGLKSVNSTLTDHLSVLGQGVETYQSPIMLTPIRQWMIAPWMPDSQPVSNPNIPTLYIIGDSTVRNGSKGDGSNGQWGWGAPVADWFDRTKINIENYAMGGTSSRSYRSLGIWQNVLDKIKPGDFVIMQFGHNDSGPINDRSRTRGTIKGNGEESEEIDNLLTGEHETVHTYGWYIRQYIKDAKAKGAAAIVCSPVPRNRWTGDKINRSISSYAQWAEQAAEQENATFIPLDRLICDHYDIASQQTVSLLYFDGDEKTHTNALGAKTNAAFVVNGTKSIENCSLESYLKL